METRILEISIKKLCNLLVIGVGVAGKDIIIQNIQRKDDIVTLLKGKKVFGIFGQANIRHFTETVEVFKEEINKFINTIALMIHKHTDMFLGSSNKNTGDNYNQYNKVLEQIIKEMKDNCTMNKKQEDLKKFHTEKIEKIADDSILILNTKI